jgi:hypothetical protein
VSDNEITGAWQPAYPNTAKHGIAAMKLLLINDDELDRMAIIRALSGTQTNIEIVQALSAEKIFDDR